MMAKFDFLLGDWNLDYRVPESSLSEAATGTGSGTFRKALGGKFVYFDYAAVVAGKSAQAHALFGWDDKTKIYRYWWFENSGSYLTASCDFVSDGILVLNWHDTLLRQSFRKMGPDRILLTMEKPDAAGGSELILEVMLTRA